MEHFSLYELNKIIGQVLAKNLEPSYWIVAEIGEMRQNRNGHCYLELVEKEDDQIKAKSRATIWSYTFRNLNGWFEAITGQSLKSGMKILCNATIQFHEVYGFSLNIKDIDAQYTIGERAKRKQEIIAKLQEDGIFEMNQELALPAAPQNIAVISSETAAGFGDFMDHLTTNEFHYKYNVKLFNSVMQGDQAAQSIISAMHQVYAQIQEYDLLVIIRGGGATLDLDCFDSYDLGSHIAQFPMPVITGIGHERDETVADLVAHTKIKTPTAVAEFIVSGSRNFDQQLDTHFSYLTNMLDDAVEIEMGKLDQLTRIFQKNAQNVLNSDHIKLNGLHQYLKFGQQNMLKLQDQRLEGYKQQLSKTPFRLVSHQQTALQHLQKELDIIDPKNVFKRGYSLTTVNGVNLNKVKNLKAGIKITTITDQLEIESELLSLKKSISHDYEKI